MVSSLELPPAHPERIKDARRTTNKQDLFFIKTSIFEGFLIIKLMPSHRGEIDNVVI
jgi:hypothetical protein